MKHDEERINPGHRRTRGVLQIVGPIVAGTGLIMIAIGMISFFSSFGSFAPPKYFWCAFIGIPLLGVGLGICKFAFLGAFFRYTAGEMAPVGKDTFNYMADGTKQGVRTVASALGRGFSEGVSGKDQSLACAACGHGNDADAKFCSQCGSPLADSKSCPACHHDNSPDARFCDDCGHQF